MQVTLSRYFTIEGSKITITTTEGYEVKRGFDENLNSRFVCEEGW